MSRFLSVSVSLALLCVGSVSVVAAGEVDPQQGAWHKKYKTQANVPDPATQLLNTDKEPDLTEGFDDLFNGKDIDDWTPKGGHCEFEVKDGEIVGTCVEGSPSTYLSTPRSDYADFIFTGELKWEIDGNTGVMFRAQDKPGKKGVTVFGPQAEMEGISGDRGWSGGVYGQSCGGYFYPLWLTDHKEVRGAIKKEGWNRITVSAQGNVVKTWVNGIPAAHWVGDGTYAKGFFGLQIHKGQAGKVRFRNLRVKELNK